PPRRCPCGQSCCTLDPRRARTGTRPCTFRSWARIRHLWSKAVAVHAMTGKDQSGHRPGAVPRSERPRAAPVPVNFGSEQGLTLQRLAGNHATAATLTSGRLARSGSVVSRKASSNQPAPKTQIDVLTERVNILERRQRADAIDLKWRAIFGERYDSYLQALL